MMMQDDFLPTGTLLCNPAVLLIEMWIAMCLYRDGEDWRSNRVVLNKEVITPKVQGNFVPLLDEVGQDFVARIYKKIEKSGQNKWTIDLYQELFKYALECKSWY